MFAYNGIYVFTHEERLYLASHAKCTELVLGFLSYDDEEDVRCAVGKHPNTSETTRSRLALEDLSEKVRESATGSCISSDKLHTKALYWSLTAEHERRIKREIEDLPKIIIDKRWEDTLEEEDARKVIRFFVHSVDILDTGNGGIVGFYTGGIPEKFAGVIGSKAWAPRDYLEEIALYNFWYVTDNVKLPTDILKKYLEAPHPNLEAIEEFAQNSELSKENVRLLYEVAKKRYEIARSSLRIIATFWLYQGGYTVDRDSATFAFHILGGLEKSGTPFLLYEERVWIKKVMPFLHRVFYGQALG